VRLRVKIAGEPFERGLQHGYLVAVEFKDAWRVYDAMTLQTIGLGLDFFVEKAAAMHITADAAKAMSMGAVSAGLTGSNSTPRSSSASIRNGTGRKATSRAGPTSPGRSSTGRSRQALLVRHPQHPQPAEIIETTTPRSFPRKSL
jgi:hypothetical protein